MRKLRRIPFTLEGYEKLKKEYSDLKEKRPAAVATLKQAREMGDLSENGLYKAARSNLSSIDFNLRRLDTLVKLAFVSENQTHDTVELGTRVKIKNGDNIKSLILVGEYEANPSQNKVSVRSPIGYALKGRKVGETIHVSLPNGSIQYTITELDSSS